MGINYIVKFVQEASRITFAYAAKIAFNLTNCTIMNLVIATYRSFCHMAKMPTAALIWVIIVKIAGALYAKCEETILRAVSSFLTLV